MVGLYLSIPHAEDLEVLRKLCDKFPHKMVHTEDITKLEDLALKKHFFEFNSQFFEQISGTAIGTKCVPSYACIFMDYTESEFLKT